jgi:hypothetical protein
MRVELGIGGKITLKWTAKLKCMTMWNDFGCVRSFMDQMVEVYVIQKPVLHLSDL